MRTTKKALDEIAVAYHMNRDLPDMHIEAICQGFEKHWLLENLPKGASFLEMGYGDGIVSEALATAGISLTILEGSSVLYDEAAKRFGRSVRMVDQLFEEYEPGEEFDGIICSHVLEHVDDPVTLLRRIATWLRRDGRLFVIVPNKESVHRRLAVLMGLQPELDTLSPRDHLVGHQRVYSLASLDQHLQAGGFHIMSNTGFFLKCLPNSMMLQYSRELLRALNEIAADVPKELLANIGVVARKNR